MIFLVKICPQYCMNTLCFTWQLYSHLHAQPGPTECYSCQGAWDMGYRWMLKTRVSMEGKNGNLEVKDGVSANVGDRGVVSER